MGIAYTLGWFPVSELKDIMDLSDVQIATLQYLQKFGDTTTAGVGDGVLSTRGKKSGGGSSNPFTLPAGAVLTKLLNAGLIVKTPRDGGADLNRITLKGIRTLREAEEKSVG